MYNSGKYPGKYQWLLVLVAMIWGSGFVAADMALESLPPIYITAVRFSIAAVLFCLLGWRRLSWSGLFTRQTLLPGLIVGTFLALGFIFQTVALRYTTPAKNAFLTSTNVVITPFLYFLLQRKAVSRPTIVAVIVMICGIGLLNYDGASFWLQNKGDALTLVCALFFACHIYSTGYYLKDRGLKLEQMVLLQFAFAALLSWIAFLFLEELPSSPNFSGSGSAGLAGVIEWLRLPGLWPVVYLGVFSTLLCFFLQNLAQRRVEQTKAAIILSLEALFGTLFSILFRAEVLTRYIVFGFGLIFCAILIAELQPRVLLRWRRQRKKHPE